MAKEARRLSELLSFPLSDDVESLLVNNLIKNCPVNIGDYRRAAEINGAKLGSLRGKTVRHKSDHVKTDVIIPVPETILALHNSVVPCLDIFSVDNFIFLGTISRRLKYITATNIESRKHKMIIHVLLQILKLYKTRGFKVEFVVTDEEFAAMDLKLL